MLLTIMKGKIHRVKATAVEPDYEGSCAIDKSWLTQAGILEHEQIHIYNVNNGERFITYAIPAAYDSGIISVNGAAARKVMVGDVLIVVSYAQMTEHEARLFIPKVVKFQ
jgi:aspartate 1-decarboxylase